MASTRVEGSQVGAAPGLLVFQRHWIALAALLCCVVVCITGRDGLWNIYFRWSHEEEYDYGFLIVLLVPVLLWRVWPALVHAGGSRWPGFAILFLAQLCVVLAAVSENYFIEQGSIVTSFFGVALVAFGSRSIRSLWPVAVLLLLTIPLPFTLQAMLTIKLQLISTELGVAMIQLMGVPVFVEGNIIDLGTYKLQVAEACSGLRYMLPLLCMSFLVAYLYRAPFWKRAIVVLSSIPLTLLLNSFRIAVTAFLVNGYGIQMAEGFLHEFEGWVVFLLGVAILVFEILLMEKFRWSRVELGSLTERAVAGKSAMPSASPAVPLLLTFIVCVAALGATSTVAFATYSAAKPQRETFAAFPDRVGEWVGHPSVIEPEAVAILKSTDYYSGSFSGPSRTPPVDLFVAYYDALTRDAGIHSPECVCLALAGSSPRSPSAVSATSIQEYRERTITW